MKKTNITQKHAILISLGLVVVAIAISLVVRNAYQSNLSILSEDGIDNGSAAYGDASSSGAPASGLTYTQAINKYKDHRIQFDAACTTTPSQISLKNNVTMMFDNRSATPRSFFLDRVEYHLTAFGFRLVTLSKSPLPHTVVVDCGTGRNNAKIILQ
jgi:hypothetical protein